MERHFFLSASLTCVTRPRSRQKVLFCEEGCGRKSLSDSNCCWACQLDVILVNPSETCDVLTGAMKQKLCQAPTVLVERMWTLNLFVFLFAGLTLQVRQRSRDTFILVTTSNNRTAVVRMTYYRLRSDILTRNVLLRWQCTRPQLEQMQSGNWSTALGPW